MKFLSYLSILVLFSICSFNCQNLKGRALLEQKIIATIISDDEKALNEATKKLWDLGGYIYIDTPVITLTQKGIDIGGTLEGGIIGKKQPNGQYPRIDCTPLRKKSSNYFGLIVTGNNLKVQNIIIEIPQVMEFLFLESIILLIMSLQDIMVNQVYMLIHKVTIILLIIAILIEIFLCLTCL